MWRVCLACASALSLASMIFCHLTSAPSKGCSVLVSSGAASCTNLHSASKPSLLSTSVATGGAGSMEPPPSAITGTSWSHISTLLRISACRSFFFLARPERHEVSCALHLEYATTTCFQHDAC